jgi:hypothetical protein
VDRWAWAAIIAVAAGVVANAAMRLLAGPYVPVPEPPVRSARRSPPR